MNRRTLLKRIGGVGLATTGVTTLAASSGTAYEGEVCVICHDDPGCRCDECIVARCPPYPE